MSSGSWYPACLPACLPALHHTNRRYTLAKHSPFAPFSSNVGRDPKRHLALPLLVLVDYITT